jgi:hypothetical protein
MKTMTLPVIAPAVVRQVRDVALIEAMARTARRLGGRPLRKAAPMVDTRSPHAILLAAEPSSSVLTLLLPPP